MPVTTTEITKYSVDVISYGDPNKKMANVELFDTKGKEIAFLRFYSTESSPAQNEFRSDLGYPVVSYPSAALASVVDILRNEKPLYFIWYDYMPVRCFGAISFGTSREPVGEEEGI